MGRIVPESQYWERGRERYWFVTERGEYVWKFWEDTDLDWYRRMSGNFYQSEKELIYYISVRGIR